MRNVILSFFIGCILGGAICIIYRPKPEIVTKQVTKDNIITVTKTVKDKSGNVVIEQTKTENKEVNKTDIKVTPKLNSIAFGYKFNNVYYINYDRIILENISIGLHGSSDGLLGVHIGYKF